jgi:hypothetical protein
MMWTDIRSILWVRRCSQRPVAAEPTLHPLALLCTYPSNSAQWHVLVVLFMCMATVAIYCLCLCVRLWLGTDCAAAERNELLDAQGNAALIPGVSKVIALVCRHVCMQ